MHRSAINTATSFCGENFYSMQVTVPFIRPLFCSKLRRGVHAGTTKVVHKLIESSMDPGSTFKLLLACPSGLPRSRVHVDFSPSYDRIPHPDANLEQTIDEIWNRRVQENPSLYNGTKFRYDGYAMDNVDDVDQESSVCLHLGLTDYRTFVGTNLNTLWEMFLVPSEDDTIRCKHTSSPLGNGAIVETSDKKVLVLQRSHNVGEFPGYFVFPGGHSEPLEIGISTHQTEGSGQLNRKVSHEMFDGIIREVVEEIGVPANSLTDPLFIGISRRDLNVRPTAFFFLNCNLESKEIQNLYSRAQDGYESTQLFAVSGGDLAQMTIKMPGCHRGGFALYELMTKASNDV